LITEIALQLVLYDGSVPNYLSLLEPWLRSESLAYLLKCGIDRDISIGHEEHRLSGAVKAFHDSGYHSGLASSRRTPKIGHFATQSSRNALSLIFIKSRDTTTQFLTSRRWSIVNAFNS
jgi:hypothetical protein